MLEKKFKVVSPAGNLITTTNSAKTAAAIADANLAYIETKYRLHQNIDYFRAEFRTIQAEVSKEKMQVIAMGIYFMSCNEHDFQFETPYSNPWPKLVFDESENFEYGTHELLFSCINGIYFIEYVHGNYDWCEFIYLALSL